MQKHKQQSVVLLQIELVAQWGVKYNKLWGGLFSPSCALIERGQRVRLFLDCLSKLRSY